MSKVLDKGSGQLVTWKQLSHEASAQDYLPCTYHYGMFVKKESSWESKKLCVTDNRRTKSCCFQQKVINNMQPDDVSFYIRSDSLIYMCADSLYAKHGRVK